MGKVEWWESRIANSMPKEVPTYTDDERVLCYQGPMLYEAKVSIKTVVDENELYPSIQDHCNWPDQFTI